MGCDIHIATEKRVGDRWVMVERVHWPVPATTRNYARFAKIAGVRNYGEIDGLSPRGFPDDASDSTRLYFDEWGPDAHTPSWLTAAEAGELWLETDHDPSDFAKGWPLSHYFELDDTRPGEYRIVFWFDN